MGDGVEFQRTMAGRGHITSSRETTLEIVLRLAPREYREHRDPKNRYKMLCPVCNYVPRGGGFTSFSIHEDRNQWACFACGNGGGPREMLGHLRGGSPLEVRPPPISLEPTPKSSPAYHLQGATLKRLCQVKGLDESWCRETLRWRDGHWYRTPAVEMPYFGESGEEETVRYRVGIDAGDRFRTRGKQVLYGLWNLAGIRDAGWVVIVEGETDFATLHFHEYPVLGVPGSSLWRSEFTRLLRGLRVYLWHEPDTGGDTLLAKVTRSPLDVLIISPPEEAKDANDLYLKEGADFKARFEGLREGARPFSPPPPGVVSTAATQMPAYQQRYLLPGPTAQ